MATPARGPRPIKEALFVQVMTSDSALVFFDETNNLGRKMPYDKPEATCAMRASADVVSFSLLKYTNKTRSAAVEARLELPRAPLDRTDRRARALGAELPENVIAVEVEDVVHYFTISRDENGVATLETPEGDDAVMELPRGRVRLTLVMHSPRGKKLVAAGFQGHLGKPGSKETVIRVTALALNLLASLATFRLVAALETVTVPPSPARYTATRPALKASDRVKVKVPVRLWTGDAQPQLVEQTMVDIELDIEQANPVSSRFLFHITPPAEAAEVFEPYRALVADAALTLVTQQLDHAEIEDLVYSIVLGELSEGDLGRLRAAASAITGLDVNPRQWVPFPVTS